MVHFNLSLLALSALFTGGLAARHFAPTVFTRAGYVRGHVKTYNGVPVNIYEGIRYGHAERFEPPQPAKRHQGVYDATRFRFACPQPDIAYAEHLDDGKGTETRVANEDCLFLNVFAPANKTGHRPVMFWIHGGTFISGTIFQHMYDGRVLALEGDVVVVTINYRLGAFGFLRGGTDKFPGNMGLMDQVMALKWVQDNIAHFGGDPHSVTIFGESAGSMSSGSLILSPAAKGLFHRAILQSGAPNSYLGSESKTKSEPKTAVLGEQLNCKGTLVEITQCLKTKTVNEILDASKSALTNGDFFIQIWDVPFLPHNPWHVLKEGHFNPVDVIQGVNRDEGSIFVGGFFPNLAPESKFELKKENTHTFVKFIMNLFYHDNEAFIKEVADFYTEKYDKLDNPNKYRLAISDVFGHYHLTCPSMLFVQLMAKKRPEGHYYAYHLDKPSSVFHLLHCRDWMGVCHAQDLIGVFGIPQRLRGAVFDEDEYKLSVDMVKTWTAFAHSGMPGKIGEVDWTPAIDTAGTDPSASLMNLNPKDYQNAAASTTVMCANKFWQPKIEEWTSGQLTSSLMLFCLTSQ